MGSMMAVHTKKHQLIETPGLKRPGVFYDLIVSTGLYPERE
jgi:hypothetical protein